MSKLAVLVGTDAFPCGEGGLGGRTQRCGDLFDHHCGNQHLAFFVKQVERRNPLYMEICPYLGILLSRKLMDSISYVRKDGKNVLSLTKIIL